VAVAVQDAVIGMDGRKWVCSISCYSCLYFTCEWFLFLSFISTQSCLPRLSLLTRLAALRPGTTLGAVHQKGMDVVEQMKPALASKFAVSFGFAV
jgi:hypothetical protein